ncbi:MULTISPECIES: SusC/RagA family TonB-linked outer membrane protein [Bacteroides]|nr:MULTISPECIES: SusC/RagA family TonB-linked outer membrane protein [Bacteroides]
MGNFKSNCILHLKRVILPAFCKQLAITCLFIVATATAMAQTHQVTLTGVVVDTSGEPLVGVSISIKGTNTGTITNADGKFTISAAIKSTTTLVFSYIGMTPQEIKVGNQRTFKVELQEDSQQLEDVVVTGFRSISKTNFTGSASKLQSDDLKIKGVTDVSRMLEGQVAGISIQNVSGTFGAAPKVRVRGATSLSGENKPLWVIDGVVQEDVVNVTNDQLTSGDPTTLLGSAVAGLNANDIESIDVLKDAAATALYGARAMNGVVVVTTKRGTEGRPIITYSGNFTIQLRPTYRDYDIMNSSDQMSIYAELERKGFLNSDIVNASNSGVYGKMYKLINTYNEDKGEFELPNTPEARKNFLQRYVNANTDWFDILFRNSLQQEHSINVSGGSQRVRSYASLSFLDDGGWTIADKVNRYTANYRNDYTISNKLRLGFQLVGSVRQQKAPGSLSRRSNTVEGTYDRDFDINPFSYALNTSRALTCYNPDGSLEYFTSNFAPFNIINELDNNQINLKMADIKAQFEANWEIVKGLKYEFTGAIRYVKSDREHMIKENSNMAEAYRADYTSTIRAKNKFLYSDPDNPNQEPYSVLPYGGFYNRTENQLSSFDVRNSLKYNKSFGKHDINMILGQQIKFANRQNFSNTGYGYQYDEGGTTSVDYRILKMMLESNFDYYAMSEERDRFSAFYYNVDYGYDKRYIISAAVRYDGSNALGTSRTARWLPTWNFSAKWNVMNEGFMEDIHWIDQLSLRSSYGLTAAMNNSASASAKFLNVNSNRPHGNEIESTITLDALENKELTWEKGYLANIGLDMGLFNRRLDVILDCWWRKGFDLIASLKTSGVGGSLYKKANYADMKSHGVELTIGFTPIRSKVWGWHSNFTLGYSTTKITNSKNLPTIYDLTNSNGGNLSGYPVNGLFSIQYVGLNHNNGVPTFIDEDGKVSSNVYFQSSNVDYLKFEGSVDPKYTGGWSNTFRWRDVSLNIFLTYQAGNKIRMAPQFSSSYNDLDAMSSTFLDRWTTPGDEKRTNVPSIIDAKTKSDLTGSYPYNAYNYSTERVANGSFLRLKTLSLSYRFPKTLLERTGFLSNLAITLAGSNLWLIYADKKLNGQDPEFYNSGGVAQPMSRQFTIALNVGF